MLRFLFQSCLSAGTKHVLYEQHEYMFQHLLEGEMFLSQETFESLVEAQKWLQDDWCCWAYLK